MYFENFQALLAMDGHGAYVWAAYAVTALVLAGLIWSPLRRKREVVTLLKARQRRQN